MDFDSEELTETLKHSIYLMESEKPIELPDLGIGFETIPDAALIATKCLVLDEQLDCDLPDRESYSIFDTSLDELVRSNLDFVEQKILNAINKGVLKCSYTSYDFDSNLIPQKSYLKFEDLCDWLILCGFKVADFFTDYFDYCDDLIDAAKLSISSKKLEFSKQQPYDNSYTNEDLIRLVSSSLLINKEMRKELVEFQQLQDLNKPVSIRQENTYLNIIGALLDLLLGKNSSGKPYSQFDSQSSIIEMINIIHGENGGLSKRNLEGKFAIARRALNSRK